MPLTHAGLPATLRLATSPRLFSVGRYAPGCIEAGGMVLLKGDTCVSTHCGYAHLPRA